MSVTNRTYLWWKLIHDEMTSRFASTKSRLENVIDTIPETLDAAYEAILGKCPDREQAQRILHIIIAATRPLALTEMNIAFDVNEECESYEDLDLEPTDLFGKKIRAFCGLFIHVVDPKINLIHQIAKEFLISRLLTTQARFQGSTRWIS